MTAPQTEAVGMELLTLTAGCDTTAALQLLATLNPDQMGALIGFYLSTTLLFAQRAATACGVTLNDELAGLGLYVAVGGLG